MDEEIKKILLEEAKKAYQDDEIPIGALIVENNKVISKAHNTKQSTHNPINHAEIIAIQMACNIKKDWRLNNCELYVTLEPCNMCKEVIRQSRIKKVYYILDSNFNNENEKIIEYDSTKLSSSNAEYKALLQDYFRDKR